MNLERPASVALAIPCLALCAWSQSFNLDVGDSATYGSPAPTYGAAANQPGHWNAISGGYPYGFTVFDLSNVVTTVTTSVSNNGTGTGDFYFNNPLTSGDDELLMDDLEDVGGVGSTSTWTFQGLMPGAYDVYTYAWAPDNGTYVSRVTPEGATDSQNVGGAWPGGHALGSTYARHCVTAVAGQPVVMQIATASGFGSVNGFQFRMKASPCPTPPPDEPGTGYCDCTASGPCGNHGGPGRGCAHGNNPAGTLLDGTGIADTAADTVALRGAGAPPNQPGLYFQGNVQTNGGAGAVFGDGLRCAGNNVIRLQTLAADPSGNSQTSVVVSVRGMVQPGDTKHYQLWFRDPQGSACGALFSLSNGYSISWQ
jgi:hypothetical protein